MYHANAHGLVAVSHRSFDHGLEHHVRLVHTGADVQWSKAGTVQFEGVFLSTGGLLHPQWAYTQDQHNLPQAHHSVNGTGSWHHRTIGRRKVLEVVTDAPFSGLVQDAKLAGKQYDEAPASAVASVVGWDRQVATVFNVDNVRVDTRDCCVSRRCLEYSASTRRTHELYFHAAQHGDLQLANPGSFQLSIPDVLMLNIGHQDIHRFISVTSSEINSGNRSHKRLSDLLFAFKNDYAMLIKSIRKAVYPLHPAYLHNQQQTGGYHHDYTYNSAPSTIPIFVMPPWGAPPLVQVSLQAMIAMLRKETGDIALFYLDTSTWLSPEESIAASSLGEAAANSSTRLTPRAHRKIAAYLSQHLCHYLSSMPEECPFRRHDIYQGHVYKPVEDELGKVVLEAQLAGVKELIGIN